MLTFLALCQLLLDFHGMWLFVLAIHVFRTQTSTVSSCSGIIARYWGCMKWPHAHFGVRVISPWPYASCIELFCGHTVMLVIWGAVLWYLPGLMATGNMLDTWHLSVKDQGEQYIYATGVLEQSFACATFDSAMYSLLGFGYASESAVVKPVQNTNMAHLMMSIGSRLQVVIYCKGFATKY